MGLEYGKRIKLYCAVYSDFVVGTATATTRPHHSSSSRRTTPKPTATLTAEPTGKQIETEKPSQTDKSIETSKPDIDWFTDVPETDITRSMLVTVLYRAEGEPSLEDEILGYPFADVGAESWYGDNGYDK